MKAGCGGGNCGSGGCGEGALGSGGWCGGMGACLGRDVEGIMLRASECRLACSICSTASKAAAACASPSCLADAGFGGRTSSIADSVGGGGGGGGGGCMLGMLCMPPGAANGGCGAPPCPD